MPLQFLSPLRKVSLWCRISRSKNFSVGNNQSFNKSAVVCAVRSDRDGAYKNPFYPKTVCARNESGDFSKFHSDLMAPTLMATVEMVKSASTNCHRTVGDKILFRDLIPM